MFLGVVPPFTDSCKHKNIVAAVELKRNVKQYFAVVFSFKLFVLR